MPAMLNQIYGREAANLLTESAQPGVTGARAALETFYHAFNQGDLAVFRQVWLHDPLIQLNNPLGGIMRGDQEITALYERIFNGPAAVWVEFHDIVEYASAEMVVFAGRERGAYAQGGNTVDLAIRTSRVFLYASAQGGWRQAHHHGSIDNVQLLDTYQRAVQGG